VNSPAREERGLPSPANRAPKPKKRLQNYYKDRHSDCTSARAIRRLHAVPPTVSVHLRVLRVSVVNKALEFFSILASLNSSGS